MQAETLGTMSLASISEVHSVDRYAQRRSLASLSALTAFASATIGGAALHPMHIIISRRQIDAA